MSPEKGRERILLTHSMLGLKPLCHWSNSLFQFSTVLRGQTTRALFSGSSLHSSTVWRNTMTWTQRYTVTLSVKPTLSDFTTTTTTRIVMCRHTWRVFPRPMQWARIQPEPGVVFTLWTDSQQLSHMKRTPNKTINTYTYIHKPSSPHAVCRFVTSLMCISQCCLVNACKY